jgi:hypothetical protein
MNLSIKELNELIYSLGIASHNGRFVNKDVNESLLEKLYSELNSKIAEEAIDEEVESSTYYVTNEEADEDAIQRDYSAFNDYASTLQQDSDRYESSVEKDYISYIAKLNERGFVAQSILDFVDKKGAATFTEMNNYYKIITGGSNSFTHILQNLRVPYKNRKTQRYLAKEGRGGSNAKWVVKVANPSNWVVA